VYVESIVGGVEGRPLRLPSKSRLRERGTKGFRNTHTRVPESKLKEERQSRFKVKAQLILYNAVDVALLRWSVLKEVDVEVAFCQ
jgi:hypothetical protein